MSIFVELCLAEMSDEISAKAVHNAHGSYICVYKGLVRVMTWHTPGPASAESIAKAITEAYANPVSATPQVASAAV
ncbi:MAG: hypothetical protein AAF416_15520 [Pseudomonadota bacterium]